MKIDIKNKFFYCLPLEINGFTNIKEAIDNMLKPEFYFNENKVLCKYCNKKFNAKKYLNFCNYLWILVIILKSFKYNRGLNPIEKVSYEFRI